MQKLEINDGIYVRAKFGCAQFHHLQAIMSKHQNSSLHLQCLELGSRNLQQYKFFLNANPGVIKN